MLTEAQIARFSRHVLLREVGGRGQARLLAATVALSRLDAEGRACALWLARAGVGRLRLPDERSPAPAADPSGLLFASDAGRPLGEAVRERLRFHHPALAFAESGAHVDLRLDPAAFGGAGGATAALEAFRRLAIGAEGTCP